MATPAFTQTRFRFRNDDGSETGATWRQNEDTADSIAPNTNFRIRIQVERATVLHGLP